MQRPNTTSLILFGFSLGLFASAHAATLGASIFPDVPSGAYYDSAVGQMYSDGIVTGYADGRFGPDDYVTRGQVAVMLDRFRIKYLGGSVNSSSSSSRSSSKSSSSSSQSSSSSSSSSQAAIKEEGAFRFTTGSYKVSEDESSVTITLIRYGGSEGAVTVEYETEDGTADNGDDYDQTSGTVSFASGKTSGSFTVPINDDSESEGNETLFVRLKNPTGGAVLGTPDIATITIEDNDTGDGSSVDPENSKGVFVFSSSEYRIGEDMDTITITVERNSGTTGSTSVQYATSNGTANSSNYTSVSGTLNFNDGESSKTFTIDVTDDNSIGGNKTVNLKLSNPSGGATLGSLSTATLTIVDDEVSSFGSGSFRIAEDEYSVSEGDTLIIVVERIGGAHGQATVEYTTQNSLAKAGDDYTETKGTLTFKEGETTKLISIPTAKDTLNDPNETFWFKLSNAQKATLDTPNQATITIF